MFPSKARIALVACGLVAALLAASAEGQGCFFGCGRSGAAPVTTYSIPYAGCPSPCSSCPVSCSACPVACSYCPAPYSAQRVTLMPWVPRVACSPVAQACYAPVMQTCQYVPQTTYRWSYSRISRTRFRPVSAVDPCTGCPTTTYLPVTRRTLLPWLHRRPEVSYRLVCSPTYVSSCSPACPPSSTIVSGGSCCPAPVTTVPEGISGAPIVDPGYASPPATFKTEQGASPSTEGTPQQRLDLRPEPDLNTSPTSMERPKLIMPSVKTAALPVRHAGYLRAIEPAASTPRATRVGLDVGGWRASQD